MSKKSKKGGLKSEAPSKEEESKVDSSSDVQSDASSKENVEDVVSEPSYFDDEKVEKAQFKALKKSDRDALKKKAIDIAKKESLQKIEDDFLKAEIAKARKEEDAKYGVVEDEEMVRHTVNLSSAADRHLINGKEYLHGQTYEVPKSLADCMRDTEHRGHNQERIRKGQTINEYGFRDRQNIRSGSGVVGV